MALVKRKGIYAIIAAAAIQLIIGVAYIWSVFQTGIADSLFNGNHAQAGLTFSILLAVLSVTTIFGGKLAARYGTRRVVFTGGVILSIGFLLASFVTASVPWLLWLTYGVMGGIGMGFTYSTTIACAQKWYPRRKGLVTGIIIAALGFGGVIFTPLVEYLIEVFGGRGTLIDNVSVPGGELPTFAVLAGIFLVVCSLGSIFLINPPEEADSKQPDLTSSLPQNDSVSLAKAGEAPQFSPTEMLKTPHFYLVTFSMFFACIGGLMMINFARPIAEGRGLGETAIVAVLSISISNSVGRIVWGYISDKLGRYNTIIILLAGSMVLSLLVNMASGYLVFAVIAMIGFFYGGILSNFPSLCADLFGSKHMATNYGFVLLGFGAGSIMASQVAGYFRNLATDNINRMFPAFAVASGTALLGLVLIIVLKGMRRPG